MKSITLLTATAVISTLTACAPMAIQPIKVRPITIKPNATELYNMLGWMEASCGKNVTEESRHGKMLGAYNVFRANPQLPAYAKFVSKIEHKQKDTTADGTGTDEKVIYLKDATYRDQPLTKIIHVTEYNSGSEQLFFANSVNLQTITANFAASTGNYAVKYNNTEKSIECPSFY